MGGICHRPVACLSTGAHALQKLKLDPLALASGLLLGWGWLTWRYGPMIDPIHPDNIELVDR